MFLGEYTLKLTGKGRVLLPLKMRQQVPGENVVLSKGFEKCLFGYDEKQWEITATQQLQNSSVVNLNARDIRRYLFSGAEITSLDSQGRFVIPSALLKYANITNEVAIIGAGDHFEIWNQTEWKKKVKELERTQAQNTSW
ncbi:division/cell wall cluster transcriptional repressor MraZ [candidate division CPR3 bacterium 4484_211]|uniref:Transcriptional regulator MraZ n=1 Tax=candidate division CPR3 bacterium 4484_211 TaxID=1968527 RepID=A0A1W9NY61_UNCC3|nr:MAG: division/cell wall cluster transcriptional repressor MraZ [candidate division CPR3 bacterium 4484_211]